LFDNLLIGSYIPGNSVLYKLDPRSKLWASGVLIILTFSVRPGLGLWLLILGITGTAGLARVRVRYYLSSIKALWPIFAFTLVANGLSLPGQPIFILAGVTLSWDGVITGVLLSLRLVLAVVLTSVFTFTTSPISLTDGLERLFKPLTKFGFPGHEVALMMTIALRFIPTIMEEGDRLVKAMQARGGDLGRGGVIKRAKNFIPLLIPLFISAFRRADELAMAMEVRCYRGGQGRTRFREMSFQTGDFVVVGISSLLLLVVLGLHTFG